MRTSHESTQGATVHQIGERTAATRAGGRKANGGAVRGAPGPAPGMALD